MGILTIKGVQRRKLKDYEMEVVRRIYLSRAYEVCKDYVLNRKGTSAEIRKLIDVLRECYEELIDLEDMR